LTTLIIIRKSPLISNGANLSCIISDKPDPNNPKHYPIHLATTSNKLYLLYYQPQIRDYLQKPYTLTIKPLHDFLKLLYNLYFKEN
jgi:hypothetical protein